MGNWDIFEKLMIPSKKMIYNQAQLYISKNNIVNPVGSMSHQDIMIKAATEAAFIICDLLLFEPIGNWS